MIRVLLADEQALVGNGEGPRRPHHGKLDVRDRAQVVVAAYESGLVRAGRVEAGPAAPTPG